MGRLTTLMGAALCLGVLAIVPAFAEGDYIVVLKDGMSPTRAARGHGAVPTHVYKYALRGYAATLTDEALARAEADPRVLFVSPDTEFHAESCAGVSGQEMQCVPIWGDRVKVERSSAKSGDGRGSVNINVAVLDTGIDPTHPDLNVVGGVNCANGKSYADGNGHGTGVAGIIGARDNSFGLVGVAPGANLWAVRVLTDKGRGSQSQILCGVDWVTSTRTDSDPTNDIAVANMSLSASGEDDGNCGLTNKDAAHLAICNSVAAGVTYVVAATNETADIQTHVPAAYDEVLTATAMADCVGQPGGLSDCSSQRAAGALDFGCLPQTRDDTFACFSNFATLPADQAHTVAAPGVADRILLPGSFNGAGTGTSFASPVVAGTVALCIASGHRPCAGLTPAQITQKLVNDAAAYNTAHPADGFAGDPLQPEPGKYFGFLIRADLY